MCRLNYVCATERNGVLYYTLCTHTLLPFCSGWPGKTTAVSSSLSVRPSFLTLPSPFFTKTLILYPNANVIFKPKENTLKLIHFSNHIKYKMPFYYVLKYFSSHISVYFSLFTCLLFLTDHLLCNTGFYNICSTDHAERAHISVCVWWRGGSCYGDFVFISGSRQG